MRKAIFLSAVMALAIALSAMTVSASDSGVTLSAPTTGTITFSGDSASLTMTIAGPLNGVALSGTGAFAGATTFTVSGSPLAFTGVSGSPGDFTSSGTLSFMLNGGTLLTGTLSNITLTTLSHEPNMVILSGSLSGGGQVTLIVDVDTPLSKLMSSELATLSAGEAFSPTVTPEPGTMLLFGSGLLLVAGVLRRKLIA
ncbi:MAG TPA: PEP-CTERM sorting domain-containing protein [Terriglobales bacterium]|jgi:PEP-CTERM motif|nr:PEP-CTERM sorting domain-containing protein [Terriglobales bacterium]